MGTCNVICSDLSNNSALALCVHLCVGGLKCPKAFPRFLAWHLWVALKRFTTDNQKKPQHNRECVPSLTMINFHKQLINEFLNQLACIRAALFSQWHGAYSRK